MELDTKGLWFIKTFSIITNIGLIKSEICQNKTKGDKYKHIQLEYKKSYWSCATSLCYEAQMKILNKNVLRQLERK